MKELKKEIQKIIKEMNMLINKLSITKIILELNLMSNSCICFIKKCIPLFVCASIYQSMICSTLKAIVHPKMNVLNTEKIF